MQGGHVGCKGIFGWSAVPDIVLVNSPVIMKAGVWEQCRVEGMVRVVMGKYDIGDGSRGFTQCCKWLENCSGTGNHARINNHADAAVAYESDRRGHTLVHVAVEENMHLGG